MKFVEIVSLVAGLLTMVGPAAQALKAIRSRNTAGLSAGSYVLFVIFGVMGVLIGVQYQVVAIAALNVLQTIFNVIVLNLISRRALVLFLGTVFALTGLAAFLVPSFLHGLVTTRWAEPFALAYGLLGAGIFMPQVLLTRRTRVVSAFALSNLILMTLGMIGWVVVAVMLQNWSLTVGNGLILLLTIELLRLKVVLERSQVPAVPDV